VDTRELSQRSNLTHETTRYNATGAVYNRQGQTPSRAHQLQRDADHGHDDYHHDHDDNNSKQSLLRIDGEKVKVTSKVSNHGNSYNNEKAIVASVMDISATATASDTHTRPVSHAHGYNNSYAKKVFQSHFKPTAVRGLMNNSVPSGTTATPTAAAPAIAVVTSSDGNAAAVGIVSPVPSINSFPNVEGSSAHTTTVEQVNAITGAIPAYPAYGVHPMALVYAGFGGSPLPGYPAYVPNHMAAYGYATPLIPPTFTGEYHQHHDMRYFKPKHHRNGGGGRYNKSYPYYKNQRYQQQQNNNNESTHVDKSTTTKLDDMDDDSSPIEKWSFKSEVVEVSTPPPEAAEVAAAAMKVQLNPQASEFVPIGSTTSIS